MFGNSILTQVLCEQVCVHVHDPCECVRGSMNARVCVYVPCVRVCMCMCMCMCVCVCMHACVCVRACMYMCV